MALTNATGNKIKFREVDDKSSPKTVFSKKQRKIIKKDAFDIDNGCIKIKITTFFSIIIFFCGIVWSVAAYYVFEKASYVLKSDMINEIGAINQKISENSKNKDDQINSLKIENIEIKNQLENIRIRNPSLK